MSAKKKITICITNDIKFDRRILRIVNSLKEVYEVRVICRRIHLDDIHIENVSLIRMKLWINKGFLFYLEYNLRLLFLLLFKKHDAIVAVDYDTILAVRCASLFKSSKLVLDAHEYFEESIEITSRPIVKSIWKGIGRIGLKKIDLAYTVSESIAERYEALHGISFKTIRNVPRHKSAQNKKGDKKILLYQGVLNRGRKLEILIDASIYLNDEYEIWIMGEGDISEELRARAAKSKADCPIRFYSWVDPELLDNYTSKAYLAYNLLENTSKSYYFSLANKFFDYIQSGVPSLNSPFPEYQKVNSNYNCCLIVECETGKDLAKYILQLEKEADKLNEIRMRRCDSTHRFADIPARMTFSTFCF